MDCMKTHYKCCVVVVVDVVVVDVVVVDVVVVDVIVVVNAGVVVNVWDASSKTH